MGMYTELILGCSLKEDTPKEAINHLKYMLSEEYDYKRYGRNPLKGGSCYFAVNQNVSILWYDSISNNYRLSARANIKNYDNEIEKFLHWLEPYIDQGSGSRDFYAIVCYEEQSEPTIYYLKEEEE